MPKTPTGPKRPRDTVANATFVMKQATGEIPKIAPPAKKKPRKRSAKR